MNPLRAQMLQQMQLKGYSKSTITIYLEAISLLSKHFGTSPDKLTTQQVRDFIQSRIQSGSAGKSWVNQILSAWKLFTCEVMRKSWDPVALPRPRLATNLPVVLAREELNAIFKTTKNLKHLTMFMVAYAAGLRIGEVLRLMPADIDSARMQIRIHQSKGCKDRYVKLSEVLLIQLRTYWKKYRPAIYLFETTKGKAMCSRTLQTVFQAAVRRAGIKKRVCFHSLRHSYATHLMEQGVSLPLIQQLLGHNSLRTTSVYLHVQKYNADAVVSPLDNMSLV